ncbi:MAG: BatA domain-containing protein [Planctomycetes bacterium]|nr:BatA domain-containing protein [Planctomycetota bacterium]
MISLANALLLGGLVAVAAPVVVHIAHRRRTRTMDWGAMRFLIEVVTRRQRQMSLDHLLLLAVRMLAIACIAFALTRPQLSFRAAGLGDLISRTGRTAAVIVIDDSLSTSAPRSDPAFVTMKRLAHAYIDTLRAGDEISLVALSRLSEPAADPIFDLVGAHEYIDRLVPTAIASDMPALIEAGVGRFSRHMNPHAELVIVTDARASGFSVESSDRWSALRGRLTGAVQAAVGTRSRPQVILLAARHEHPRGNLSVAEVAIDRTLLPPGRPVTIIARLIKDGAQPVSAALVRLMINGRTIEERTLDVPGDQSRQISFVHSFDEPGSHLIEVAVEGARDALAEDDRRSLAVEVESVLPVLLVEGRPGTGLDGSLGLLAAALAPRNVAGATGSGDLFAVSRVGADGVTERALSHARVAVLGDVPALDAEAVSALERFVVAGGGIFIVGGPDTDRDLANRFWSRGGDGFLPTALGAPKRVPSAHPVTTAASHPAVSAFAVGAAAALREVAVSQYLALTDLPPDLERILELDDGNPLLVTRTRGRGRVALFASSLDGAWNDLPYRSAFVPLSRSLVGWLGGNILPPRNLIAGDRLAWFPAADGSLGDVTAQGPDGQTLPLMRSAWEGHPALVSAPLTRIGAYAIRTGASRRPIWFQVGLASAESRLSPLTDAQLEGILAGIPRHDVADPAQVSGLFTIAGNRTHELWRWLIAAGILLLIIETVITQVQSKRERSYPQPATGRPA